MVAHKVSFIIRTSTASLGTSILKARVANASVCLLSLSHMLDMNTWEIFRQLPDYVLIVSTRLSPRDNPFIDQLVLKTIRFLRKLGVTIIRQAFSGRLITVDTLS